MLCVSCSTLALYCSNNPASRHEVQRPTAIEHAGQSTTEAPISLLSIHSSAIRHRHGTWVTVWRSFRRVICCRAAAGPIRSGAPLDRACLLTATRLRSPIIWVALTSSFAFVQIQRSGTALTTSHSCILQLLFFDTCACYPLYATTSPTCLTVSILVCYRVDGICRCHACMLCYLHAAGSLVIACGACHLRAPHRATDRKQIHACQRAMISRWSMADHSV